MASTSETGHDIDITNSEAAISIAEEMGSEYQPPVPELAIAILIPQVKAAALAQTAVNEAKRPWETATNERENLYEGLKALSTRIWGTISILRIPQNTKDLVEAIHKKLQGKWGKQALVEEENDDTPAERSASQLSFVSMAKNFEDLIENLKLIPEYIPNEDDKKITTLETRLTAMKALNKNIPKLQVALNNARNARNKLYYTEVTGLIDTMKGVKGYFITLGTRGKHPAYVAMNRLKFTTPPVDKNKAEEKRKKDAAKEKKIAAKVKPPTS